jgi:hypothetical protein
MDKQEILARIELIIASLAIPNEDKIALKQGCDLIRKAITREEIIQAIIFVSAIAGIAALGLYVPILPIVFDGK